MTEGVRRRKSKWDLKDDPHPLPSETREDNTWSGRRNMREDESYKRDCNEISHTSRTMHDDRSYSRSMSPGLDDWRLQHRSRSPKNGWSRSHRSRSWSRSRSPPHGFRHGLENDRRGNGSRLSAPASDNYAAGRCQRGHDGRFPHQDIHDYNGRRHSGSSPGEDYPSRHERGGSLGNAINEAIMDRSRDKISHNEYALDLEKNETLRSTRSFGVSDSFPRGRGQSCRYAHPGASSDGHGMRERAHDRTDTNASFGHDNRREPRRTMITPCKFHASGNCRNGDFCRFSHDVAARGSPERRSRDNRQDHDLNHENRSRGGPETRLVGNWGHSLNDENRSWDGLKWSDKPVDSGIIKSPWRIDNDGGKMSVLESRSVEVKHGQKLDNESRTWGGHTWNDKPADRGPRRSPHSLGDNSGSGISLQDSTGNAKLHNSVNMPLFIGEHMGHSQDLHAQNLKEVSLQPFNQNIAHEVSGHSATLQPTFSEKVYNNAVSNTATPQNEVTFSADMVPVLGQSDLKGPKLDPRSLTSFSMNGRNQPILATPDLSAQDFNLKERVPQYVSQPSSNSQQHTTSHQMEPFTKPDIVDLKVSQVTPGTSLAQNLVTSEQVAKLTNLSASLAQIFGNGQQLPQLYAALNPHNPSGLVPTTHLNSAGPVTQVVTPQTQLTQVVTPLTQPTRVVTPLNQANQTTPSQKQYDPISDSIESSKLDSGIQNLPGFSTKSNDQNKIADGELQPPLKAIEPSSVTDEPNGGDSSKISSLEAKTHEGHELKPPEKIANQSAADQKEQNTAHSGDMDVDGQVDEDGKKSKEAKGMRMFRFALVDFVKELLKPTWKEGQLSKDAHKTIVKKVVEKVTGSIQGAQIPQTQEKIDHYLSSSKPKLSKLVQAYVEKYQKS